MAPRSLTKDAVHRSNHSEVAKRAWVARKAKGRTSLGPGKGHPSTSDVIYTADETELIMAVDAFKLRAFRKFPTVSEILRVAKSLGYAKAPTCPTSELDARRMI